jgi:hypothetical protein
MTSILIYISYVASQSFIILIILIISKGEKSFANGIKINDRFLFKKFFSYQHSTAKNPRNHLSGVILRFRLGLRSQHRVNK